MSYPSHFVLIYLPNAISVPLNISTDIRPIYQWIIMGSYKKIGLNHEMDLIDTPPPLFGILNCEKQQKEGIYNSFEDLLYFQHFMQIFVFTPNQ